MKTAYYLLMLFPATTALFWLTPCHGDACLGNAMFGLITLGAGALVLPLGIAVVVTSIGRRQIDKIQFILCAAHVAVLAYFGWALYNYQPER